MTTITDTRVDWSKVKSVTFKYPNQIPYERSYCLRPAKPRIGLYGDYWCHGMAAGRLHLSRAGGLDEVWLDPAHLFEPLPATP